MSTTEAEYLDDKGVGVEWRELRKGERTTCRHDLPMLVNACVVTTDYGVVGDRKWTGEVLCPTCAFAKGHRYPMSKPDPRRANYEGQIRALHKKAEKLLSEVARTEGQIAEYKARIANL